ncbi:TPA: argininosuccinate lyase [Candidatus Galligastranaerophilus gallistercoris]|nr:argininosuccinate lyase [Candidatus Galligastranaerophilus gallistercoris]
MNATKQLWGSRFSKPLDKKTNDFNSSLSFDYILYKYDIKGSIAHTKMLSEQNIITNDEKEKIVNALNEILSEIDEGKIQFDFEYEDIHTFIEKLLVDKIGDTGKKVHTARSRNDQVALDIRLYLKDEIKNIQKLLIKLIETLISIQEDNLETLMPGYTHLQRAQATTLSHHTGAYVEMFKRDKSRLDDVYSRVNILPLGACALAGTPHNINRYKTAEYLNFGDICLNSADAVSDRDFIIETLSSLSILMTHISRMAEEIIIWSSFEFKFIELDDSYSTGSSIMPQKKNPDIMELLRGKTGRVFGSLINILTVMKGLPLAYNKDMQEDKEPLFDSINTVKNSLSIIPDVIKTMKINKDNMFNALKQGFIDATDVADYLVKKNVSFRDAHNISGNIVSYCIKENKTIQDLKIDEFKSFSPLFEDDIHFAIDFKNSINAKKVIGSPSIEAMKKVIEINKNWLKDNEV